MPRSIARQRITKNRIGGRSIAARYGLVNLQAPYSFPPGSYTFTVPKSGYWKFVLWGPGAGATSTSTDGGGSGAYVEVTKNLAANTTVALVVSLPGAASTATFPDGTVASAGAAALGAGGSATGGDVNLNGSAGGATGGNNAGTAGSGTGGGAGGAGGAGDPGGAGAPANLPFRGGTGGVANGTASSSRGGDPGGGAGCMAVPGGSPGRGAALAYLVRE